MLELIIPAGEKYDPINNEFIYYREQKLTLEHSLISLSKWECKWKRPFLKPHDKKTDEETIDYISCMIVGHKDPSLDLETMLTSENIAAIKSYIEDPMTATTFTNKPHSPNREIITSELIYYWMIALNIPMECEKWHLNRLLTLINVCSIKNTPSKKMKSGELAKYNSSLNAARRARMHSRG